MRIFIALDPPQTVKDAAIAIRRELMKSNARVGWVRPENIHLTLKFLGEVPPSRLPEIESALTSAAAGIGPIKISVRGLGLFPGPDRPRVVWVGIQTEDDRLSRLQERIDRAVTPLGFLSEKREFRPHLTLGRFKSSRGLDELMKAMAVHHDVLAGECVLAELHLMQSELRQEGAVHNRVWSVAL